ncbi:MAG: HNH endonuclease [Candidatus Pacebacteria bacterium]|nr:HNH endonuclease [Candidatus Paceibacterota bacterium]
MTRARKKYEFSSYLREERLEGTNYCCERCGIRSKNLEVHHLVGAWLAAQNYKLTPSIIRVLENEMCLCSDCHQIMNDDQETWTAHDIGFVAWALFDLDPYDVKKNQKAVYSAFKKGEKRAKKNKNRVSHRRQKIEKRMRFNN